MTAAIKLPTTVLFACTHNMIRSPMAEGLMKSLFPNKVFADSCGIDAGIPDTGILDGFMINVMDEINIDMSQHKPKSFLDLNDDYFDLIVCFSDISYGQAVQFAKGKSIEVEYWPVFDSGLVSDNRGERIKAYRLVRGIITEKLKARFAITD